MMEEESYSCSDEGWLRPFVVTNVMALMIYCVPPPPISAPPPLSSAPSPFLLLLMIYLPSMLLSYTVTFSLTFPLQPSSRFIIPSAFCLFHSPPSILPYNSLLYHPLLPSPSPLLTLPSSVPYSASSRGRGVGSGVQAREEPLGVANTVMCSNEATNRLRTHPNSS